MASSIDLELDGTTADASVARRALRNLIGVVSDPDFVDNALLITTELVTNIALHTTGSGTLRADYAQRLLRVEVTDRSDAVPVADHDHADVMRIGGRGLRIVDRLATRWGTKRLPNGKTVWFELENDPHEVSAQSTFNHTR